MTDDLKRIYGELTRLYEYSQKLEYSPDNIDKMEDAIQNILVQLSILQKTTGKIEYLGMAKTELDYAIYKFLDDSRGYNDNTEGQKGEYNLAKKEISDFVPDILQQIETKCFS